jgi:hypothetical protein
MESKKIIAIIPARGLSKSIKFKNLKKIKGKTLIELCFDQLKKVSDISDIYCSTESSRIIRHCKKIGLKYVRRPKKLSSDNSNVFYTVKHTLNYLKSNFDNIYKYVILVQPTSPFFLSKQVKLLIKKIKKNKKFSSVQTVHKTPHNYHFLNSRIVSDNYIKFKFDKERSKKFNKQKKDTIYSFGNLCITKTDKLLKSKNFFCKPSNYVTIDRFTSFDLDNLDDFNFLKSLCHFFKK